MRRAFVLAMALALTAAACGGDDAEPAAAAPIVVESPVLETEPAPVSETVVAGDVVDTDETAPSTVEEPSADVPAATTADAGPEDEEAAALAFAQCMRDEGLDFTDPVIAADGSIDLFAPMREAAQSGGIPPEMQAAIPVCGPLIQGASFLPTEDDFTEIQDQVLAFAQCLRENGVDVQDPDFSNGLAGGSGNGPLGDFDPDDPANADAIAACQSLIAGLGGN